jgi:winged helix DNA-binding protein
MTSIDLPRQRLSNQRLSISLFSQPAEGVAWLGAVQSQDYAGAKWAVAQRAQGPTDSSLDQALADGTILRTHVLRPTWHFVTPEDIRWLLELTARRVRVASAYQYRALGLDQALLTRSNDTLARALQGGNQLTRSELGAVLQQAGISAVQLRLAYLIINAELDQVICSGARRGKQFTYALLEERAPRARELERAEALAEVARRYFTSHGPASVRDFVWWSGLTTADARQAIELAGSALESEKIDGQTYYFAPAEFLAEPASPDFHLLPNYDEYLVGYRDRGAAFDASNTGKLDARQSVLAQHTIVIDGQVVGTWSRAIMKDSVLIKINPFRRLAADETAGVAAQCSRYADFLAYPLEMG